MFLTDIPAIVSASPYGMKPKWPPASAGAMRFFMCV